MKRFEIWKVKNLRTPDNEMIFQREEKSDPKSEI